MDAILIGVAFLTVAVILERNVLFVSSTTVALQTSADSTSTTASDYAQTLTTTTDRYPRLYAENDNYGKQNPPVHFSDFYQFSHYTQQINWEIVIAFRCIRVASIETLNDDNGVNWVDKEKI